MSGADSSDERSDERLRTPVPDTPVPDAPGTTGADAVPAAMPGGLSGRLPERAMSGSSVVPGGRRARSGTAAPAATGHRVGDERDGGEERDERAEAAEADRASMARWCAGEAAAFDALYARHRGALYRYVLNGCGDEARAHELFQDIWLRVIDARLRYSPDAPFRAWLYRIARNRLIDHYRRQPDARHEPFDEETMGSVTEIAPPLSPEEVASLVERGDVLHAALQRLPPAQREAIVLQHVAGMRLAEIAEVVGENAETVKSRLRYALVKLRAQLRAGA